MSIDIQFVEKTITLLDKELTIRISDDNLFEHYFDISELKSKWHIREIGQYHFSRLIGCLLQYYWYFKLKLEDTPEQKGVNLIGKIIHALIQQNLEKNYGFVIIERPCIDECEDFNILGKVDIIDILEHREDDIKTTSWLPILVDLDEKKIEEKYGKYLLQVLAYAYFLNKTYFQIDPLRLLRIVLVDKMTLTVKLIEFDYNEELGEYFYLKLRARAGYLHDCILNDTPCTDGLILDKNCLYCNTKDEVYCPKGAKLVKRLTVPETIESIEFKRKHGKKKKPFWKYSDEKEKWIKSKEFIEFLKKEKGYTAKQIEEVGW